LDEWFDAGALAKTPPMGWSSWNAFGCTIDEDIIRAQADALVDSGMRDLGYRYVNIDDCWQAPERGPDGGLVADPVRFPSGIAALADYVHARGLRLGLYSSPGATTCDQLPGSMGYEVPDALRFASWGIDYLKYDRCSATEQDAIDGFITMRRALDATERPIVFSINPNGATWHRPWRDVAHLWRTTPDIKPTWSEECSWKCGIAEIIDRNAPLAPTGGQGGWNDPDMLEVGVTTAEYGRLSPGESRMHFALWAIMAAPLIAGADLRALTPDARAIYTNAEIIAVNQDVAGVQGWRVRDDGSGEVWLKPLADDGARAVALVNRSDEPRLIAAFWEEIRLARGPADVRDLWTGEELGTFDDQFAIEVAPHDVTMLRIDGTPRNGRYEAEAPHSVLGGGAHVAACTACSGGQKIEGLAPGATLRATVEAPLAGARRLTVAYSTAELRTATLRIDGGLATQLRFPSTGSFERPAPLTVDVALAPGPHTIDVIADGGWAPNLDVIELE
jgi:alpha-galactosidase